MRLVLGIKQDIRGLEVAVRCPVLVRIVKRSEPPRRSTPAATVPWPAFAED
jgi:hypothetical protein